jgi:uncharacterized protein (DUF924 family)
MLMSGWREIYEFWFGKPNSHGHGDVREFWFGAGLSVDEEIRQRFLGHYESAAAGQLGHWKDEARSWITLIVLLDQFPRNIFRGDKRSFATDPLALEYARGLTSSSSHSDLITVEKLFAYLPFEHSEDVEDQKKCLNLYRSIDPHQKKEEWLDYARQHSDIIDQFRRFPHRNAILARESTWEEEKWLATNDQRFGTVAPGNDPL